MFKSLADALKGKFSGRDDLSRQIEIVQVLNLYRQEVEKFFPKFPEAKPLKLKNQVLTVSVESSVLANELRLHEQLVVKAVNEGFGREMIKRVVYRF